LLDGIVVGEDRPVEGALELLLRMGGAEEVAARADLAEGVQRLPLSVRSTPFASTCIMPSWSVSMTNFS
jgi:hypothetical protein